MKTLYLVGLVLTKEITPTSNRLGADNSAQCVGTLNGMGGITRLFQSPPNVIALTEDTAPWSDEATFQGTKALVINDNEALLFDTYWGAVANTATTTLVNPKWVRFPTQWSSSVIYSS